MKLTSVSLTLALFLFEFVEVPAVLGHPITLPNSDLAARALDAPGPLLHYTQDLRQREVGRLNKILHLPFRNYPSENDHPSRDHEHDIDVRRDESVSSKFRPHLPFRDYASESDGENLVKFTGSHDNGDPEHLPFSQYPPEE
ncbi:hypothetical protein B0H13DRAFT_2096370 [Mycena leptocephala]|nr:hypothetical protein B0H13DRAFT_2096370 [Mycena leptocephala]